MRTLLTLDLPGYLASLGFTDVAIEPFGRPARAR
jgi:hypothetical protein